MSRMIQCIYGWIFFSVAAFASNPGYGAEIFSEIPGIQHSIIFNVVDTPSCSEKCTVVTSQCSAKAKNSEDRKRCFELETSCLALCEKKQGDLGSIRYIASEN